MRLLYILTIMFCATFSSAEGIASALARGCTPVMLSPGQSLESVLTPSLYQPWTATLTPPESSGTTLVTYANGSLPLLVCTGAQTVAVNPAGGWGAVGVNRFTLGLYIGSASVTIATNGTPAGCNIRWGHTLTLSTTRTNQLLFRSVGTNDWVIYGSL